MREQFMYAVYDAKAGAYLPPFVQVNRGVALRAFAAAVNEPGHDFGRFASDYTLFEIGSWNMETGRVEMHVALEPLGMAQDYLHKEV